MKSLNFYHCVVECGCCRKVAFLLASNQVAHAAVDARISLDNLVASAREQAGLGDDVEIVPVELDSVETMFAVLRKEQETRYPDDKVDYE